MRTDSTPAHMCRVASRADLLMPVMRRAEMLECCVFMLRRPRSYALGPTVTSAYRYKLVNSAACAVRSTFTSKPQVLRPIRAIMPCLTLARASTAPICCTNPNPPPGLSVKPPAGRAGLLPAVPGRLPTAPLHSPFPLRSGRSFGHLVSPPPKGPIAPQSHPCRLVHPAGVPATPLD